jgi:hypothetical protein
MKSLEVSRAARNSSQNVFGLICMWVLLACVSWKSTLIVGNSEKLQQSIEVTESIVQRRIVILCKTFETITGESWCVLCSYIYVLSSWEIYLTKCKQELKFMWKSNVVLGLCGLKTLRRRNKVNGLKRKRSKQSDPLEASNLSLMKKVVS